MSLQAVVNPLEFMKGGPVMEGGIPNMGGFDTSDLMARPEMRQAMTRNQANMVSAPYEQANRMAAEKTNPMNAMSQNPGKVFLMSYLGKKA